VGYLDAHISVLFHNKILDIVYVLLPHQVIFMDGGNSKLSQQVPEFLHQPQLLLQNIDFMALNFG
jgi:hypothetical protein